MLSSSVSESCHTHLHHQHADTGISWGKYCGQCITALGQEGGYLTAMGRPFCHRGLGVSPPSWNFRCKIVHVGIYWVVMSMIKVISQTVIGGIKIIKFTSMHAEHHLSVLIQRSTIRKHFKNFPPFEHIIATEAAIIDDISMLRIFISMQNIEIYINTTVNQSMVTHLYAQNNPLHLTNELVKHNVVYVLFLPNQLQQLMHL